VTVNTPASQGACGFLSKKGRIELGAVTIDCRNEYAAILVIALDDRPLVTSRKILIQAVTEDRPFGWKVQDGRITDLGTAPLGVRQIDATITLRLQGDAPIQVQALDENGYGAARKVRLTGTASEYQVQLSPDSLYHVLTR
jgi:hypothetical protein